MKKYCCIIFYLYIAVSFFGQPSTSVFFNSKNYNLVYTSDFDTQMDFDSKWTNVRPYNEKKITTKTNQNDYFNNFFLNSNKDINTVIGYYAGKDTFFMEDGVLHLRNMVSIDKDTIILKNPGVLQSNSSYGGINPNTRKPFVFDPNESGMLEMKVKFNKTPGLRFCLEAIPEKLNERMIMTDEGWKTISPRTYKNNVNENGWFLVYLDFFNFTFGLENVVIPDGNTIWSQFNSDYTFTRLETPFPLPPGDFYGTAYDVCKQMLIDDNTWYEQWHILNAVWTKEGFVTYVDGKEWATVTYNKKGVGLPKGKYQLSILYNFSVEFPDADRFGKFEINDKWKEVQIDYIHCYKAVE